MGNLKIRMSILEELENLCKREVEKMEEVFRKIKVIDSSGLRLFNLALSYFYDSKYFLERRDLIRSFEAIVISWAYVDAGLNLKVFEIPEEIKSYFTA